MEKRAITPVPSDFLALEDRQINADTAKVFRFSYHPEGQFLHTYPRYWKGAHVANQFRLRGEKTFRWEGSTAKMELIGQHAFEAGCAKSITIVEGACDVGAAYELQGSKWPVVGVTAASSALKEVRDNYEYLAAFDRIVVCLDSDEPGRRAAQQLAEILPLGKTYIVTLRKHKDANDYLRARMDKEFIKEWWDAPCYTPSGLRLGSDMWKDIETAPELNFIPYPWPSLTEKTYGLKLSEFVTINAPTGVGKTTITSQTTHHILMNTPPEVKVGLMKLEETNRDTALSLLSIHAGKRLHLPDVWADVDKGELRKWYDEVLNNDRVVMWDHFGSNSVDAVLAKIEHMAALGCKYIVLDHLSIIVSDQSGDERKQLDEVTTKLKTACMAHKICLIAVIHQNRQGQIRGTAGVEQLSNDIFKLERDMESPDDWRRNVVKLTIQKNRFSGNGGNVYLFYNAATGRLDELTKDEIDAYENGQSAPAGGSYQPPDQSWDFNLDESQNSGSPPNEVRTP